MLPEHVNIILLSATVPNTREFADWVGYAFPMGKGIITHVILDERKRKTYTSFRPRCDLSRLSTTYGPDAISIGLSIQSQISFRKGELPCIYLCFRADMLHALADISPLVNPYGESRIKSAKLPVFRRSREQAAEVALLLKLGSYPPAEPHHIPISVPVDNTQIVEAGSTVHLEQLHRLGVEVGVSDHLEEEAISLIRMSGHILSIILGARIYFQWSTLSSARSDAKNMRGLCRIWICAMLRRRARCISPGSGR